MSTAPAEWSRFSMASNSEPTARFRTLVFVLDTLPTSVLDSRASAPSARACASVRRSGPDPDPEPPDHVIIGNGAHVGVLRNSWADVGRPAASLSGLRARDRSALAPIERAVRSRVDGDGSVPAKSGHGRQPSTAAGAVAGAARGSRVTYCGRGHARLGYHFASRPCETREKDGCISEIPS